MFALLFHWLLHFRLLLRSLVDVKDVGYVIVSSTQLLLKSIREPFTELRLPEQLRGLYSSNWSYWRTCSFPGLVNIN
jgi:hypothetical protein